MSAIPNYTMQMLKLPMSICEEIDRINKNFLLGTQMTRGKFILLNGKPRSPCGLIGGVAMAQLRKE